MRKEFTLREIDRIIEMAWEDRTTFDAIYLQFSLKEQEVIDLMRREMKPSSFRMWRQRVQGRKTKHAKKRLLNKKEPRFKCSRQKHIAQNKISKR
ncbi:TIGR03643 family protein [Aquimarina sp. RZ0]|uniref:TIGR03643 family protein n=1 Tax=Aquimarina sp. RZ0 TaxID=2607730 RepID=UPI0011F39CF8|nr:TIGR03643 family protein [Aquimarina sp. RZ0]KAA1245404.1 TIGR03643 family protein [Aquimarina sp. RZ0]